ncbi:gram-negative bacterial tonB protein [mine drainage metagenome]|uniref:Gram-negative bacterial tonB protein n=1 Tax=mine drainage metagenome TaxID=410659 RepID=A0A1J5SVS0_9ZZZZ
MTPKTLLFFLPLFICATLIASDTLYFRLSNPWNTVKSPTGNYLRKCIKENDYCHCWDYNASNILVTESFYSDTNFTRKLFCHKYYNGAKGFLEQIRCYENGRLNGYFVDYNEKGDTTDYQVYKNGELIKEWSSDIPDRTANVIQLTQEAAEFPGGQSAWISYLSENLTYPKKLKKEKISGQVIAKIYIAPTGTITNVEIIKSLHPLLDYEVIRVIKSSPKWEPAKQNGKAVQMTFTQTVNF